MAERLTIGLVYDDSLDRLGGVGQHVTTLARELSRRGHRVKLLVGASTIEELAGIRVHSLSRNLVVPFNGNRPSTPVLTRRRAIRHVLAADHFDVLHVQLPFSPLMAGRAVMAADFRTAVIGTFHITVDGMLPVLGARALRAACARPLARFDSVVAVSDVAARFAARTFGLRCAVVPNMVRLDQPVSAPRRLGAPHLVFVGNLVPRKGVEGLLDAFDLLTATHPDSMLTIAGDGPLRRRLARLTAANANRVRFAGTISEAEKAALLGTADIACFPSLRGESFGVVLLEAIAAGAGVAVGGDNEGHRELLEHRREVIADAGDPVAFAETLRTLTDPGLRDELRAWQQQLVRQYDARSVTDRILAVYRRALARRRGRDTATVSQRVTATA